MGEKVYYYQRVYLDILKTIQSIYSQLLTEDEQKLLDCMLCLSDSEQKLVFRLLSRSRNWYRIDRLNYDEIQLAAVDMANMDRNIIECGPDSTDAWLSVLSLDDLRKLAVECEVASSVEAKRMNGEGLREAIVDARPPKQCKLSFDLQGGMTAVKIGQSSLVDRIKRLLPKNEQIFRLAQPITVLFDQLILPLYFVHSDEPEEELKSAMMAQVNRRRYPQYHIVSTRPIFIDRDAFERYVEAKGTIAVWEGMCDEAALVEESRILLDSFQYYLEHEEPCESFFLRRFKPAWILGRCLDYAIQRLEAIEEYEQCIVILQALLKQKLVCHGRRGGWWERLIIDSKHLNVEKTEIVEICSRALEDEYVRMGVRWSIKRRLKIGGDSQQIDDIPVDVIRQEPVNNGRRGGSLRFQLSPEGDRLGSVEELALRYYAEQGWEGVHSESGVFTFLFALLFWDILFCAIPDVFQTPYQTAPLDLRTDAFYDNRRLLIEERIHEIETGMFKWERLQSTYEENEYTMCVGVNWEAYSFESLRTVFKALGPLALTIVMRALAEDYHHYSAGMPDLVLCKETEAGEHDLMLVEVKSERDKLSDQQRSWLEVLVRADVQVRLCRITSKPEKS